MQTTLMYNIIEPKDDVVKLITPNGFIDLKLHMDVITIKPKESYIFGVHYYRDINTTLRICDKNHCIYKVLRKLTVPPWVKKGPAYIAELVEVEVLRTNDVLAYNDILYGDFESWNNFY